MIDQTKGEVDNLGKFDFFENAYRTIKSYMHFPYYLIQPFTFSFLIAGAKFAQNQLLEKVYSSHLLVKKEL